MVKGWGLRGMNATALRIPVIGLLLEGWTDVWWAGEIAGRSMRDAFRVMPRWLAADSGGFWGVGNGGAHVMGAVARGVVVGARG